MDNPDNRGQPGRGKLERPATVVDFPPPLTEGQKEWEQRFTAELRTHLPNDQVERREVLAVMKEAIERRSSGERAWERAVQAAYLLSMFPNDYRMARRVISQLFSENGA